MELFKSFLLALLSFIIGVPVLTLIVTGLVLMVEVYPVFTIAGALALALAIVTLLIYDTRQDQ